MSKTTIKFAGKTYRETMPSLITPEVAGHTALTELTGPQLVELYNLVSSNLGQGRVKRFSDSKAAVRRTWTILTEWATQPEDEGEAPEPAKPTYPVQSEPTDELQAQKAREAGWKVDFPPAPVQLTKQDKAQVKSEAASRPAPAPAAPAAQLDKDAEMPALRKALKPINLKPMDKVYPRREGSKQAIIIDLLSRPQGATFGELFDALAATGKPWRGVTIRSGLAWDTNHIAGYGVTSELLNGEQFAQQGRDYEAERLGVKRHQAEANGEITLEYADNYDPDLKLAVYRLTYPKGMTAPLPHDRKKA